MVQRLFFPTEASMLLLGLQLTAFTAVLLNGSRERIIQGLIAIKPPRMGRELGHNEVSTSPGFYGQAN